MGAIRKTASVATLGMINFRSKKEKLARARRSERAAVADRDAEHLAREVAESSFERVEHELRRLTTAEMKAARQLSRLRRRSRRVRKAERLNGLLGATEPKVHEGIESARSTMKDLRRGAGRALEDARSAITTG